MPDTGDTEVSAAGPTGLAAVAARLTAVARSDGGRRALARAGVGAGLVALAALGVLAYTILSADRLSDDQRAVAAEFGYPRTFAVTFTSADARRREPSALETWDYYELGTRFIFRNGRVVLTRAIEALPIDRHAYPAVSPADFEPGMSVQDLTEAWRHAPATEPGGDADSERLVWSGVVAGRFRDGRLTGAETAPLVVGEKGDALQFTLQGGAEVDRRAAAWELLPAPESPDALPRSWTMTEAGVGPLATQLARRVEGATYSAPVERAILEAKLRGARLVVVQTDPARAGGAADGIAQQLVIEVEIAEVERKRARDPFANRYLERLYAGLGWVLPALASDQPLAAGSAAAPQPTTAAPVVPGAPLTEGVWIVDAIVWKADGTVAPVAAPEQPFTGDLLRYGDGLVQYWFRRSNVFKHKHEALIGEGTYEADGPVGEMTFSGDELPMDGTVRSASYYHDEASDTLYVIEHWVDKWDGKPYDRVLLLKRK